MSHAAQNKQNIKVTIPLRAGVCGLNAEHSQGTNEHLKVEDSVRMQELSDSCVCACVCVIVYVCMHMKATGHMRHLT